MRFHFRRAFILLLAARAFAGDPNAPKLDFKTYTFDNPAHLTVRVTGKWKKTKTRPERSLTVKVRARCDEERLDIDKGDGSETIIIRPDDAKVIGDDGKTTPIADPQSSAIVDQIRDAKGCINQKPSEQALKDIGAMFIPWRNLLPKPPPSPSALARNER